jgi:hypothetical protein
MLFRVRLKEFNVEGWINEGQKVPASSERIHWERATDIRMDSLKWIGGPFNRVSIEWVFM